MRPRQGPQAVLSPAAPHRTSSVLLAVDTRTRGRVQAGVLLAACGSLSGFLPQPPVGSRRLPAGLCSLPALPQAPGSFPKALWTGGPCHPLPLIHTLGSAQGRKQGGNTRPRATTCRPLSQTLRPFHLRKCLKLVNIYPSKADPWLPATCGFPKKTNRGRPGGRNRAGSTGRFRLPEESAPPSRGVWGARQGGQGNTAPS